MSAGLGAGSGELGARGIFEELRAIRARLEEIQLFLNGEHAAPGWERLRDGRTNIYLARTNLLEVQTAAECAAGFEEEGQEAEGQEA